MGKRSGFDRTLTEPEVGIRALWLLYKRGQWGSLEDFGLVRRDSEPALKLFEKREVVTGRLTKRQCRRLITMVPGLEEAGKELRLAYILKEYEQTSKRSLRNGNEVLSRGSQDGVGVRQ